MKISENEDLNHMLNAPPRTSITVGGIERRIACPPDKFFKEMVQLGQDVLARKPGAMPPSPFLIAYALFTAGDPQVDWDDVAEHITIEQLGQIVREYMRLLIQWGLKQSQMAGSA